MTTEGEHDIPRDEVVDRVLGRLSAALPPDSEAPGDRALVSRSVERLLAARMQTPPRARVFSTPMRWVLIAAASTTMVTGATMAVVHHRDASEAASAPTIDPAPPARPAIEAVESNGIAPAGTIAPPSADSVDRVPTLDVSSLPTASASNTSSRRGTGSSAGTAGASGANTGVDRNDKSAAELFASANDARRRRDVTSSRALYHELQTKFPRSAEAITSYVTLGRLELDVGRSNDALVQFDRYLASGGGELREDAMAGRASALENLGRATDEKRAWEALLATYPKSLFSVHAKQRLGVP
jgi:TolA-binding protein